MDMNELIKLGAAAFMNSDGSGNTGSGLDMDALVSALSGLSGGSDGNIDIGSILSKMQSGGMADLAQSWLGDGENQNMSNDNVAEMFGNDKISEFASKLGLSQDEAVGGLRDAMPQMVDKASSGGSLLESIGGIDGALNLASKLFGR